MPTDNGLPIRELQLATLVDEVPAGDEWLHEQKFDGYRILAHREGRGVTLLSRRWKDWTAAFPSVAEAVAALPCKRAVLDGEVAVVMPDGRTSFQALQNAIGQSASNLVYFAFDLLALDGEDLRALPLEQRKERLATLLGGAGGRGREATIRYSDHVVGGGAAFFTAACKAGLEGIVSKRRDRPYLPGRGAAWLKVKCIQRQELVIGGFTEPEGSRSGFGSLLVGYYQGGKLVYAGKVGTGYSHRTLTELRAQLDGLVQRTSPFEPEPQRAWTGPHRHWVRPELVCEIAFSEWTADGRLRHPSFQGLRLDKRPADVVRERPLHAASGGGGRASEPSSERGAARGSAQAGARGGKRAAARVSERAGARGGKRAGARVSARAAARSSERAGARGGKRAGARVGARAGERMGKQAGARAGERMGKQAGARAGERVSERAGSPRPAAGARRPRRASTRGARAAARRPARSRRAG